MKLFTNKSKIGKSRGFTLLELMVAVGIIAVVLVAIMNRYSQTKLSTQVNTEVSNINAVVSGARSAFAGQGNFNGITIGGLITAGAVPAQMGTSTSATNSWGTAVTAAAGASPFSTFNLTYAAPPASACISLISATAPTANSITVGSTVVKNSSTPLSNATLTTACTGSADVIMNFTMN